MSNKEKVLHLSDKLFFLGYGVWLLFRLSRLSLLAFPDGSIQNTALHLSALLLFAVSFMISVVWGKRPSTKVVLPYFVLLFIGVIQEMLLQDSLCIDLAFIFASGRNVDFRTIAKFTLLIEGIGCLVVVGSSLIGLIPNYFIVRGDGVRRYYLGFAYCTFLSHLYLNFVLLVLYLRRKNICYREVVLLVAIDVLIFALTNTKNSFILVLLALSITLVIKIRNCESNAYSIRLLLRSARIAAILLPLLSLVIVVLYNPQSEYWRMANSVMSNRLEQTSASLNRYGFKPFGQDIEFVGNGLVPGGDGITTAEANPDADSNYIDNSYLQILVSNGLVVAVAVWIGLISAAQQALNMEDEWLALILLMLEIHSLFDPQLIQLVYNTFLFCCLAITSRLRLNISYLAPEGGCGQ